MLVVYIIYIIHNYKIFTAKESIVRDWKDGMTIWSLTTYSAHTIRHNGREIKEFQREWGQEPIVEGTISVVKVQKQLKILKVISFICSLQMILQKQKQMWHCNPLLEKSGQNSVKLCKKGCPGAYSGCEVWMYPV